MTKGPILHYAFKTNYKGLARELVTPAGIGQATILLQAAGKPHAPIKDRFLQVEAVWDTGATDSVISSEIVRELGLKPVGKIPVIGVNGSAVCNQYVVDIFLPNGLHFSNKKVTEGQINTHGNIHLLVGMDVISVGDFNVSNYGGKTSLSFSFPPHEKPVCLFERAEKLNARLNRKSRRAR